MQNGIAAVKNSLMNPGKKLKLELPFDSATSLLGTYPLRVPQWLHWLNNTLFLCLSVFSYTVTRILLLSLPKCLLSVSFSVPAQTLPWRVWPSNLSPLFLDLTLLNPPSTYQLKELSILCIKLFTAFYIKGYYQKSEKATHRMRENICKTISDKHLTLHIDNIA